MLIAIQETAEFVHDLLTNLLNARTCRRHTSELEFARVSHIFQV